MKSKSSKKPFGLIFLSFVTGSCVLPPQDAAGQICPGRIEGLVCRCEFNDPQVTICVEWTEALPPVQNLDFSVDFACPGCDIFPHLELITGGEWTVRSRTATGDGDIGLLDCPNVGDFDVWLGTGFSDRGAESIKEIRLEPLPEPGGAANHSNLKGGYIGGDVIDAFILQEGDGGTGGICTFSIDDGLTGSVDIPKVDLLHALGVSTATINVGEILGSGQLILGNPFAPYCGAHEGSDGPVTIGTIRSGGQLLVTGNLNAAITVTDGIEAGGRVQIVAHVADVDIDLAAIGTGAPLSTDVQFGNLGGCTFAGDLTMASGVNSTTHLKMFALMQAGSSIDLNNQGVAGRVDATLGGTTTFLRAGAVTSSGLVVLADGAGKKFSGRAMFSQVDSGGSIRVLNDADLDGRAGCTGTMAGTIWIDGDVLANPRVGTIDVNGASTGFFFVNGSMLGLMDLEGDSSAPISIGADVSGDIDIAGDVLQAGSIDVGAKLTSTGRILIAGLCDAEVTIHDETVALSLIRITEGIDVNSIITVNDGGRNGVDANGTIHIGPVLTPGGLPAIIFDGSILIKDGPTSGGDLNGTITVKGCHATPDPLDICICGDDFDPNINIIQDGCSPTVFASCVSGCP